MFETWWAFKGHLRSSDKAVGARQTKADEPLDYWTSNAHNGYVLVYFSLHLCMFFVCHCITSPSRVISIAASYESSKQWNHSRSKSTFPDSGKYEIWALFQSPNSHWPDTEEHNIRFCASTLTIPSHTVCLMSLRFLQTLIRDDEIMLFWGGQKGDHGRSAVYFWFSPGTNLYLTELLKHHQYLAQVISQLGNRWQRPFLGCTKSYNVPSDDWFPQFVSEGRVKRQGQLRANEFMRNHQCWEEYLKRVVNQATRYSKLNEASLHWSYTPSNVAS